MDIEKSFWFDITIQYLLICSIESRWSVCNELLLITVFIWKSIPLSDSPPTSPPPTSPLSLHLSISPPDSSTRLSAVTLPSDWWDFTDISCWHIQTIVLPLRVAQVGLHLSNMAQLQGGAPCQVRPRSSGNRGAGMGLTVLCCTCFALTPYPSASPAILPPQRALLPSPSSRAVKPVKSTKLSRSDGRGQNSIWCALFVDCVRLVAEGTRRGAYHAEMEWSPHPIHQTPTSPAK